MTGMQDVEAAVGEHDFLVVRTGVVNGQQQLLETKHATLGTFFTLEWRGAVPVR
jgi:hypothetical protein